MDIRKAKKEEWEDCMSLVWRTFRKFEAKDYSEQGVTSFLNFISDQGLYKMFLNGDYKLFVAAGNEKIYGVISVRTRTHISLLFVDEKWHKKGIGTQLIDFAAKYVRDEEHLNYMTVNAAPYAVDFYHKLGFVDTGARAEDDGIIYTPMRLNW